MEQKPELIPRVCACGCKRIFKCLPTSKQLLYSIDECRQEEKETKSWKLEFAKKRRLIDQDEF